MNGHRIRKIVEVQVVHPQWLYSDAGRHISGSAMFRSKMLVGDIVFQIDLTEAEMSRNSTFRELRGI